MEGDVVGVDEAGILLPNPNVEAVDPFPNDNEPKADEGAPEGGPNMLSAVSGPGEDELVVPNADLGAVPEAENPPPDGEGSFLGV